VSGGFHRIIVGVDLGARGHAVTRGSRLALDRARWLGERFQSEVTLVHSTAADEYWEAGERDFVLGDDGIDANGRKLLDSLLDEFRVAGVSARLHQTEERAWLEIIREALRWEADLIVGGKRTESFEDGRKIGSVAKKILRKAPCAVWLEDPRRALVPRVVVAATDLTAVGRTVLELSASLSSEFDAELHAVHAYSLPMSVQMEGDEAREDYERVTRSRAEKAIRAALEGTPVGERARLHVGLTSPTRGILHVVDRTGADLVVMGTVSRGGIAGFLVGNTAERLFDTLDCALLAVKPVDFVCPVREESS
jgi:nucleotide-binding universal stress UspA family protein